jgi:hypothetical protein
MIAIDFDDTVVEQENAYSDTTTPLRLKPGALEALMSLKMAGHVLILWSGRNNRSRMYQADLDPLVRAGVKRSASTDKSKKLELDRWKQMVDFCNTHLPGVFDAIDDGQQGKPAANLFIDDKAIAFGANGLDWPEIAAIYGEKEWTAQAEQKNRK